MRINLIVLVIGSFFLVQCQSDKNIQKPVVYAVGDSTVKNGQGDGSGGLWGWGDFIDQFLDASKVTVKNHALGGTSSRTFIQKGLWKSVLDSLKKGDYVLIQFGHNDNGPINDNFRARGTIKGTGEATEEIDNMLSGEHEIVHTYGWYLRKIINETKQKGGIPILMSPIPRNNWENGKVVRNNDTYGLWSKQIAMQEEVTFVDLNGAMALEMEKLGQDKIYGNLFYEKDHTHTTAKGAAIAASIIAQGLKESDNSLKEYLLENPTIVLPKKIRMYLIGDSTMANNGIPEAVGWGVFLPEFMDTTRVQILNKARGGRSSRSFHYQKLWQEVRDSLKPGDYVLMQFGHNDGGFLDKPKYRGSLMGIGDSTVVVQREDQTTEVVHSYGWYMTQFIKQAQKKGAVPIVLSPIPRNIWNGKQLQRADESYGLWAQQAAIENQAIFININDSIAIAYEEIGEVMIKKFFPKDHTHTDAKGATFNAAIVAKSLKSDPDSGLKKFVLGQETIDKLQSNVLNDSLKITK